MTNVEELDQQNQLTIQAYNEAITYTLKNDDGYGLAFLNCWNEGDWLSIHNEWPEFDLNSEAQKWLITQSGGMPKD